MTQYITTPFVVLLANFLSLLLWKPQLAWINKVLAFSPGHYIKPYEMQGFFYTYFLHLRNTMFLLVCCSSNSYKSAQEIYPMKQKSKTWSEVGTLQKYIEYERRKWSNVWNDMRWPSFSPDPSLNSRIAHNPILYTLQPIPYNRKHIEFSFF